MRIILAIFFPFHQLQVVEGKIVIFVSQIPRGSAALATITSEKIEILKKCEISTTAVTM